MAGNRPKDSVGSWRAKGMVVMTGPQGITKSRWLADWWRPLFWIMLTPLITVPVSAIAIAALSREAEEVGLSKKAVPSWDMLWDVPPGWTPQYYHYAEVVPTFLAFTLPGLINLAPFLWVFSTEPRAKVAGLLAGFLGVWRVAAPAMVLASGTYDKVTSNSGTFFELRDGQPHEEVWLAGSLVWLVSVMAFAAYARALSVLSRPHRPLVSLTLVVLNVAGVLVALAMAALFALFVLVVATW